VTGADAASPARLVVVLAALGLIALSTTMGTLGIALAPAAATLALLTAVGGRISWRVLLVSFLLVVMFIPIRLYEIAANLPFQLEPYRLATLLLAAVWITALLVDPEVRARGSALGAPIALLSIAVIGSIVANSQTITDEDLTGEVAKKLTFWVSFLLVFYLVLSLVRTVADVVFTLEVLVLCGGVLGLMSLYEWKTGHNFFAHLSDYIPILRPTGPPLETFRAGLNRAYASAQHPIAFGAAMALLLPFATVFAYRTRRPIWIASLLFIMMGALASISRTSMLMLLVVVVVLAILRPQDARRAIPLLVPLAVVIQLALPGTFSTTAALFLPKEGLVSEQANQNVGSGRVASFSPALEEAAERPVFGRGFGTRIVNEGPKTNSFILDDEWLSTLLEIGLVGVIAWVWIFWRSGSRAWRVARRDDSDVGWLMAAFVAAIASFAVGMFFFDAFSFIQVTILLIVLLALAEAMLACLGSAEGAEASLSRTEGAATT
jgi:hypothetical protein